MAKRLIQDAPIISILRTRLQQDVAATTRAVLKRVGSDPVFAPLQTSYVYTTLHHYRPKDEPFDWETTPQLLFSDLADEPRASVMLEELEDPGARLHFHLNCEGEIVKEKVNGRMRNVPKASNSSVIGLSAGAAFFVDPTFIVAYGELLGAMFEFINGEYGYSKHLGIRNGTGFDRGSGDPFEPWFITWANLFGPELVERFGRERLLGSPAHEVRELAGGSIILTVSASPMEQLEPEVQERIARVKAHLGILSPSERAAPEELAAFEARRAAAEEEMKRRVEEAFRKVREETTAEMQRQAEGCVEGVKKIWGKRLDFRPRELAVLDKLIRTGFGPDADDETIATAVQAFGAYTGETVRRTLGGVWHDEEMNGQPVLLGVGKKSERVGPFQVVAERFEDHQDRGKSLQRWYRKLSR